MANSTNHGKMGKGFGFAAPGRMNSAKCSKRKGPGQDLSQVSRSVPLAAGTCTSPQLTSTAD